MRALVLTNMYPSPAHPARGRFVFDQVQALRGLAGVEVELFAFEPGSVGSYAAAGAELRRRFRGTRFDVVHAHFGLTAWPALSVASRVRAVTLHGTDVSHPRSRLITLAGLPFVDLVGVVSEELAGRLPGWTARHRRVAVLSCGVDLGRFRALQRSAARAELGLDPDAPCVLFPSDPARAEKRFDRAAAVAGSVRLLTLVDVDPDRVPLYVNAANAVLVTSDREGFGLAALEALACDVPVLSTPHGIAPEALAGVEGTFCGPFDLAGWRSLLEPLLAAPDPRVNGRSRAEPYSSVVMAERVLAAWKRLLG